jgi:isopentenyl-diphosphate Delta-isomerase
MKMLDNIILLDENDNEIGAEEKIKAHKNGKLHRAFSIFILNSKGELLLQQRAKNKYHSGGLWSNTCCGHPRPDEDLISAAHRRLKEEMGFDCPLKYAFKFRYEAVLKNGLIENEIDNVLIGESDREPKINNKETSDFKWISIEKLKTDIVLNDNLYTIWFKIILMKHFKF